MFRLAIRTLPVFAVIIGFAMALAAYMNFSGVRSAYVDLIRSRMTMMAEGVGNDISAARALGIRLTEQTTLSELLTRQALTDPLMLSIDVAADDGSLIFSSDADRVGKTDTAASDSQAFREELKLVDDLGEPVGTVIVRLDRAAMDSEIDRFRFDVLNGAVPAGIGAVVAGSLACLLLLIGLHRRARRSADANGDDTIDRVANEIRHLHAEPRS